MSFTNDQVKIHGQAPSATHEVRSKSIVEEVKNALADNLGISAEIYLQGSYVNRTNINNESDVDIVVEHPNYYYPDFRLISPTQVSVFYTNVFNPAPYDILSFRNMVLNSLISKFGNNVDDSGDKCIKVNFGDMHADVVPAFIHYGLINSYQFGEKGIRFHTKSGNPVVSFPKEHIKRGEDKNILTNGKFKETVRVLKSIRKDLIDAAIIAPQEINSFLIENTIWNLDPINFVASDSITMLKNVLLKVWKDMQDINVYGRYTQIDGQRLLLQGNYASSQVKKFMEDVWRHAEFT